MASKVKSVYVCSECGFESAKWYGKCPSCGEWNTLNEELKQASKKLTAVQNFHKVSSNHPQRLHEISDGGEARYKTGINELDRVLGGGIVKGSLILIGGDPGIGKSTILLQVCNHLGKSLQILYVSGEESTRQLKLRATRLGVDSANLLVLSETDIELIEQEILSLKPDLVMIDSIQTMNHAELNSSTGSVTQVKECTNVLMRVAKSMDVPILIVGHVNKDGNIAGPKVLEHIVDAVLYFEGDRQYSYRILRAIKNRFGSTNEIGVFYMSDKGLDEVENPSVALLTGRPQNVSGTCVACVMEGSRPILAEIQGLVSRSSFGNPRRMSTGFDYNRMSLLLAVLEKRSGYFFSTLDAYLNVVGGLKLYEPSADLAVALALVSSLKDVPIDDTVVAFGEIGLAGEIRAVSHTQARINEAVRLGFKKCIVPFFSLKSIGKEKIEDLKEKGVAVIGVRSVRQAFSAVCSA